MIHTCTASGEFTGSSPVCIAKPCSPLSLSAEYVSTCSGEEVVGERCMVECAAGHTVEGTASTYTCRTSGNFSGSPPRCNPNRCEPGSLMMSSDLNVKSCANITTGQHCSPSCALGFTGAASKFTCTASGFLEGRKPTCSADACPTLNGDPRVKHDCNGVRFEGTCSAGCSSGYLLQGNVPQFRCSLNRALTDLVFEGNLPLCQAKQCVDNLPWDSFEHDCDGIATGGTCSVGCMNGTDGRTVTMRCGASGTLTGTFPLCTPTTTSRPYARTKTTKSDKYDIYATESTSNAIRAQISSVPPISASIVVIVVTSLH